ncbi:MAG: ATP-binding cassette domain-containing protein [Trueperaceae bacterium]|nr:ATP-binding cassette domain-containing protein [Trueperaceae bacterium]
MTVAVETKDVWKTYPGGVRAVRGADIRIEPGELMVLVGPSGCGKTTILRMIAGLERITAGEILVGDRVVNKVAPSKRGVALVFQNFALYPHKTAAENIAFPLESAGVPKSEIQPRVAAVAEMLELTTQLDRRPGELSGGQQQRVALGRAIVRNPSVLLLDEPLSNLDARLRVVMRTELKRIQRAIGSTAVYVTHDQVEAMTMGDRIVVMNDGVVDQIGTPQEVYLTPASVAVAKTIGSPAMNLLAGVASATGGAVRIEGDEWALELDGDGGAHVARSLEGLAGARVVLGVRPVDLDLRASAAPRDEGGPAVLASGTCLTAEPLGSETLYNVTVAKELVRVLRYETHVGIREGERASVALAPGARLHVFDETSGKRLAGVALQADGMGARWRPYENADPL